jgi:hypothetical protein
MTEKAKKAEVVKTKALEAVSAAGAMMEVDALEQRVVELETKYKGLTADASTTAGMTTLKAARLEIREDRYKIPHIVKGFKDKVKILVKSVDDKAAGATERFFAIENPVHKQIEDEEKRKEAIKETARLAAAEAQRAIDEKIDRISKLPLQCIGKSSDDIKILLDQVAAGVINQENYPGDNLARAESAKAGALAAIQTAYDAKLTEEGFAAIRANQDRVDAIQKKIDSFTRAARIAGGMSIDDLQASIDGLALVPIGDDEFMEFRAEAQDAKVAAIQEMADTLAEKVEAKRLADEAAATQKAEMDKQRAELEKQRAELAERHRIQEVEEAERTRLQEIEAEKQKAYFADLAEKAKAMQDKIDAENSELKRQQDALDESIRVKEVAEAEERRKAQEEADDKEAARQSEVEAAALAEEVANDTIIRPTVMTDPADGPETVTIPLFEYNQLLKSAEKLEALEAAGVDNWDGYDEAMNILKQWREEGEQE